MLISFVATVLTHFLLKIYQRKDLPRWAYRWLLPGLTVRFRARMWLSFGILLTPLRQFSLLPIVASFWGEFIFNKFRFEPFGFALGIGLGYAAYLGFVAVKGKLTPLMQQLSRRAALNIAGSMNRTEAEQMLLPATQHPLRIVRVAAIEGLKFLGTPTAVARLEQMSIADQHLPTRSVAEGALAEVRGLLLGKEMLMSVERMDRLAAEHAFLMNSLHKRKTKGELNKDLSRIGELEIELDLRHASQLRWRLAFPDLYCKECYARAEQMVAMRWRWVRCRQCKRVEDLQIGVKTVVGQIGGTEDWKLSEGLLAVNLWDDAARRFRIAQLDTLQIVGGQPINYDWAVNAMLDHFEKWPSDAGAKPSIQLVGNPPLEANTLNLLRASGLQISSLSTS